MLHSPTVATITTSNSSCSIIDMPCAAIKTARSCAKQAPQQKQQQRVRAPVVPVPLQRCEWAMGALEALYVALSLIYAGYTADAGATCITLLVLLASAVPSRLLTRHQSCSPLWTSAAVPAGALCVPLCLQALLAGHEHTTSSLLCTTTIYAHTLAAYARVALANAAALAVSRRLFHARTATLACLAGAVLSVASSVLLLNVEPRLALLAATTFFATVYMLAVGVGDASFALGDCVTISHVVSTVFLHLSCLPARTPPGFRFVQLFDLGIAALQPPPDQRVYTGWVLSTEALACGAVFVATALFAVLCGLAVPRSGWKRLVGLVVAALLSVLLLHVVFVNYTTNEICVLLWVIRMIFVQYWGDSLGLRRILLFILYIAVLVVNFFVLLCVFKKPCCNKNNEADEDGHELEHTKKPQPAEKDEDDEDSEKGEVHEVQAATTTTTITTKRGVHEEKEQEDEQKPQEEKKPKKVNTLWRKYFHLLALVMFVPGLLLDSTMVTVPLSFVACAFVVIEIVRATNTGNGVGRSVLKLVDGFYALFAADQDRGRVTTTHIFLFAGIVLPCWLAECSSTKVHWLAPYSGLVAVGVGDAAACVAGKLLTPHTHRWLSCMKKTIEGTTAGVAASVLFGLILWLCERMPCGGLNAQFWVAMLGSMLQEAFLTQIDNLALPLHFFVLLVTPVPSVRVTSASSVLSSSSASARSVASKVASLLSHGH